MGLPGWPHVIATVDGAPFRDVSKKEEVRWRMEDETKAGGKKR